MHDYNNLPAGLVVRENADPAKPRWTLVIWRPLDRWTRILAYFGIYVGPQ